MNIFSRVREQRRTIDHLTSLVHEQRDLIALLFRRLAKCPPGVAQFLIFVYTIDGVTFKSKHMALSLPVGKQVTLTLVGQAPDPNNPGQLVNAPLTNPDVSSTDPSLVVTKSADGLSFVLKAVSNGAGQLNATASNSLNGPVSGADGFTAGTGSAPPPPPPLVATSLNFQYSDPVDAV